MTMQVSKGEFDRRVKLLEQKVRDSSNGLISRLQAETEAFIEKLRNTELNIENLENEVAGTEANLDNLVTSFNNYKANTLRVNDVFDANGQFDGSKIKPLSIDTAAISVGQRSQQLTLTGVNFTVNDYSSGNGKLIWTGGTMFHYGFEAEDGKPKLYTIYVQNNTGEYSFQNGNAHYIYAVFKRDTKTETTYNNIGTISKDYFDNCDSGVLFLDSAGTTPATTYNSATTYYLKQTETISNAISGDNTAYILVTTSKISVDGNIIDGQGTFNPTNIPGANYSANQKLFYIQLGYVSGTLPGSNGYNYRKVDMTYGSTTINGRLITTGRIEGNNVALDLDTGEIKGKITFVPGQDYSAISSALNMSQYATTSSVNEVNGQKTVSETIYMSSGATTKPNINTIPSLPSDRVTEPTTTWESWGWQRNWTTQICSGANWYYTCIQTYKLNSSGVYISGSTKYSKIEYSDNISTSAAAIKGTTTVDGGLILTRKIICGSASGTSAISGVGNYAFWAGASEPSSAKAYIKHNGDSYFKSVIIDNNNFKLKNEEITSIDSIAKLNIGNASCGSTENYRLKFVINETPDFNKYTYYCSVKYKYRVAEGQSIQTTSQTYPITQQNQILQGTYIVEQIENQASIRYRKAASGMTIYTNGFTLENSYTYSGIFHLSIYYLFSIQHQGSDNGIKSGSVTLTEF